MKRFKQYIISGTLAIVAVLGVAALPLAPAMAVDPAAQVQNGVNKAGGKGQETLDVRVQDVINVLLFLIGAVSVIMIIIGGLRYIISNGDSSQITSAKNTILYAVIGLVVALLAYAIVGFVINQFKA